MLVNVESKNAKLWLIKITWKFSLVICGYNFPFSVSDNVIISL